MSDTKGREPVGPERNPDGNTTTMKTTIARIPVLSRIRNQSLGARSVLQRMKPKTRRRDGGGRERRGREVRRKKREVEERKRRRKEGRRRMKIRRRRKKKKKKDKKKDKVSKGAVTHSWGKYGIIREVDMWNKRPDFTAWLLEVKQVNLESLPNWEEKQMFKQYVFALIPGVIHGYLNFPFYFLFNFVNSIKCIRLSDLNTPTATFPHKKYFSLDAYHRKRIEKAMKKGSTKATKTERVVFDDEEQCRLELQQECEKQKEAEVEALKRSM
ncbi:hypothetical protein LXL04_039917 [Taraxacum kok-saghyz]